MLRIAGNESGERRVQQVDDDHYARVAKKLSRGGMIPFLGAGANLCDRGDEEWRPGQPFLPSGRELAAYLAAEGLYPKPEDGDLMRVSQYVEHADGEVELYRYLREVFAGEYRPTSLHRLLGRVARDLAAAGLPQLLAVTTNYDDLLERALHDEGLDCDVVWYEAKQLSADRRKFVHKAPGTDLVVIQSGNDYPGLPMTLERPVVLKLHGCVDREQTHGGVADSFVITEDNYIGYLTGSDVRSQVPIALVDRMIDSSFLFLGYSLVDWNMRVILNRIWGSSMLGKKSWAVQREPSDPDLSKIERTLWSKRENMDVDLVYCELGEYVRQLEARLPAAAATTPAP
jgi:hypothetical protein